MELRIRELWQELGISLAQMSRMTGISKRTLENYVYSGVMPPLQNIERIAATYEVNPAWLVGWTCHRSLAQSEQIEDEQVRLPPYWNNDHEGRLICWK